MQPIRYKKYKKYIEFFSNTNDPSNMYDTLFCKNYNVKRVNRYFPIEINTTMLKLTWIGQDLPKAASNVTRCRNWRFTMSLTSLTFITTLVFFLVVNLGRQIVSDLSNIADLVFAYERNIVGHGQLDLIAKWTSLHEAIQITTRKCQLHWFLHVNNYCFLFIIRVSFLY